MNINYTQLTEPASYTGRAVPIDPLQAQEDTNDQLVCNIIIIIHGYIHSENRLVSMVMCTSCSHWCNRVVVLGETVGPYSRVGEPCWISLGRGREQTCVESLSHLEPGDVTAETHRGRGMAGEVKFKDHVTL